MMNVPLDPKRMTSTEAAALILSGGRTRDVELATTIANAPEIDFDALRRSGLQKLMGFDFSIKYDPHVRYILVLSKQKPYVHTRANIIKGEVDEYGDIVSEKLIERLVAACVRLKEKREKLLNRDEKNLMEVEED